MDSNELKETDVKNRTCYYFDDIIKLEYLDFDDFLVDEKLFQNILVFDITLFAWNSSCITFDEINEIIIVYDAIRYLILFGPEKYDVFTIESDILAKKVALHMLFLMIMQKSTLIFTTIYSKLDFL